MYSIKKATLLSLLDAARNSWPNEFFSLLGGDRQLKKIDEFIVVPAQYGRNAALIKRHLIPHDPCIMGSAHSHPSPNMRPSRADLNAFAGFGELHLIIPHPFDLISKDINNRIKFVL